MTPHWIAHGIHILASIELIEGTLSKGTDYCAEPIVYQGILRTLHTLFESAHKLPDDIKQQHRSLEWASFSQLRNLLVHDYLGDFDQEDAWKVINEVLPLLKDAMLSHLPAWKTIRDSQ